MRLKTKNTHRKIILAAMFKCSLLITLCLFCFNCFAQFEFGPTNARANGYGDIRVINHTVFSAIENQAGLTKLENFSIGLAAKNHYFIGSLNSFSASAALPTNSGTFGLGIQFNGIEGYSEIKAGLAYARELFEAFSIGIQLNANQLSIDQYGNKTLVNFELGVQAEITNQLIAGGHVSNPIQMSITEDENLRLPSVITIGIKYLPSEKLNIMAEVEKSLKQDAIAKAGLEYYLLDQFALRLGVNTNPNLVYAGFGLNFNSIALDFSISYHPQLGYSPMIGFVYGI